jgi:hypothetical protein
VNRPKRLVLLLFSGKLIPAEFLTWRALSTYYEDSEMIDIEILAAILKELGYFDEDEHPTNKTESESGENEQDNENKRD